MSSAMVNLIMITLMITEGGLAVGAALAPVIVTERDHRDVIAFGVVVVVGTSEMKPMIIADGAVIAVGVVVVVGTRGVIIV